MEEDEALRWAAELDAEERKKKLAAVKTDIDLEQERLKNGSFVFPALQSALRAQRRCFRGVVCIPAGKKVVGVLRTEGPER